MPPIICIVGKNKIDKTFLMEGLIRELKMRGLNVGVLKHHKHDEFEIDIEGKDTWKYAKAGADAVAISSPVKFAVIKNVGEEAGIEEICDRYLSENDIVLADGFTLSDKPRIIVAGSDEEIAVFERECMVVAVVGKAGTGLDNIPAIADKLLDV